MYLVGDGVLWSRICHRLGEEDQGELSEGGLDSLHLPRGAQGKVYLKNTQRSPQRTYTLYNCTCIADPTIELCSRGVVMVEAFFSAGTDRGSNLRVDELLLLLYKKHDATFRFFFSPKHQREEAKLAAILLYV